ncbi:hypothetical protein [Pseudomonas sp. EMN2]|uniref:hypothetical protein n=1 Tax=Pseudomonas sp. EMN2 TaxID=2615212 RepID=UPI00129AFEB4|nr:hypothetical protein [Pseudomonas sp. EMN2]
MTSVEEIAAKLRLYGVPVIECFEPDEMCDGDITITPSIRVQVPEDPRSVCIVEEEDGAFLFGEFISDLSEVARQLISKLPAAPHDDRQPQG